jgi:hypothetical protein
MAEATTLTVSTTTPGTSITVSSGNTTVATVREQFNTVEVKAAVPAAGATAFTYTNATEMPEDVGGWVAGSTFDAKTLQQMFDGLLYPYQTPSFNLFYANENTIIEVGDSFAADRRWTWAGTNTSNIAANSLGITYSGSASGTIATGLSYGDTPYDATHPAITLTSPGSVVFTLSATDSNGGSLSRTYTSYWRWRVYYGTSSSTTLDESGIEGLASSLLTSSETDTYSFAAGDYKYFAWPDSFGSPTASTGFKDTSTNLAVAMADSTDNAFFSNEQNGWYYGTVSVTNTYGQTTTYRVYRTKNVLGGSINIQVS